MLTKAADRFTEWIRDHNNVERPLIPAATVVLLRDGPAGIETLMMRKTSKINYGGIWVFPGGKLDPEDYDPANPDDMSAASRNAAVRETAEEAGLTIAADDLVTFSHWVPPLVAPQRFSTWFFLAQAPAEEVTRDHREMDDHAWWAPCQVLERRAHGAIELVPPTYVTLYYLLEYKTVADALEQTRASDPYLYATWAMLGAEGPVAVWEPDASYETDDLDRPGTRHRLTMAPSGWRFELP